MYSDDDKSFGGVEPILVVVVVFLLALGGWVFVKAHHDRAIYESATATLRQES